MGGLANCHRPCFGAQLESSGSLNSGPFSGPFQKGSVLYWGPKQET